MLTLIIATVAVATIVAFLYLSFLIYQLPNAKLLSHFPHPPRLPFLGNMLDLIGLNHLQISNKVLAWHKQYGSPLWISVGPFQNVQLSDPDHIEALTKSNTNITKSREYDHIRPWLGDGLLSSTDAKWHSRRKLLTPTFHYQILKEFVPIFHEQNNVMAELLRKRIKSSDKPFDICPYLAMLGMDIICETAMGRTMNAQQQPESGYITELTNFGREIMERQIRPWLWPVWAWNLSSRGRRAATAVSTMHSFTKQVIREREAELKQSKQSAKDGSPADATRKKRRLAFLDLLLEMQDAGQLTPEDVRQEVDTFMFEGQDTTATALMIFMHCIAAHEDVQDRLREEILAVWGDKDMLTSEDFAQMPYLDAVLKESQRMLPSVPFVGRRLTEPLKLDENYTIPAGVMTYMYFAAAHHNPKYFPEPEKFDPERFNQDNAVGRHPFAFVPFSAGARNCIGQKFAVLEMKVTICSLLRHFKLSTTQRFDELHPSMLFVFRPTGGVWVTLTEL